MFNYRLLILTMAIRFKPNSHKQVFLIQIVTIDLILLYRSNIYNAVAINNIAVKKTIALQVSYT